MKRGNTAVVLILVLVVAALGAFSMFSLYNPSGAQTAIPGDQCCESGVFVYPSSSSLHNSKDLCQKAYFNGYKSVLGQCPAQMNKQVDVSTCKETERVGIINGCMVTVCCNAMS